MQYFVKSLKPIKVQGGKIKCTYTLDNLVLLNKISMNLMVRMHFKRHLFKGVKIYF
jgi:hypothetical protein